MMLINCFVVTSCNSQQKKKEEAARIEQIAQEKADSIARAKEQERLKEQEKQEEQERIKKEQEERGPKGKGWRFICQRLRSPSTAKLAGYVGPEMEECQALARKLDIAGLSLAMFSVDAQNGYGATIREEYMVFYKNGEPMHVEWAEAIAESSISMLKTVLKLNGFDD